MEYFPLFLTVKGQKCLVIGAGKIPARKIEMGNLVVHIDCLVNDNAA